VQSGSKGLCLLWFYGSDAAAQLNSMLHGSGNDWFVLAAGVVSFKAERMVT
jgi:hypothetical protein